jgi:hypothetical protein
MNIYLVSTKDRVSYDEYDAVVVIAENEKEAIIIAKKSCGNFKHNLEILDIGIAHNNQEKGEVLASFNAG